MSEVVELLHRIHRSRLNAVILDGIRAASDFPDLGLDIRRGVVYCWLRKEDDVLSSWDPKTDHVYVGVIVDTDRCVVADMDIASLAMMYHCGKGGRPQNPEASRLLAEVYSVTAMPLSEYQSGMFSTPEVLVKGDIAPEHVRPIE